MPDTQPPTDPPPTDPPDTPPEVREYLAAVGRKGGQATSEAKAKAARENAKRPRPSRRKAARPQEGEG